MKNPNRANRNAIKPVIATLALCITASSYGQPVSELLKKAGALGATAPAASVDPLAIKALQNSAVRTTLRHFPRVSSVAGATPTVHSQVFGKPSQQALGRYAEEFILEKGEGWKPVKKSNAPQNDLYRFNKDGKPEGMQVKLHKEYNFKTYLKDLEADNLAEYFAVADDHADVLKKDLLAKAKEMRAAGNIKEALKLEKHAARIVKIGATHAELEKRFILAGLRGLCTSAVATAAVAGASALFVDLAILGFENRNGTLTGAEIEDRIVEACIKAGATGAATAVLVMCGASPVGWVVVVAGTAAYIVTDTAIFAVKEVVKVPTVAEDAIPYILNGWKETAWQPS